MQHARAVVMQTSCCNAVEGEGVRYSSPKSRRCYYACILKFPVKLRVFEKTYFCEKYKKMAFNSRMRIVFENIFKNPLLWPWSLANTCCALVPSSLLGPSLSEFKKPLDKLSGTWWGCPVQGQLTLLTFRLRVHDDSKETSSTLMGHFWGRMLGAPHLFACASLDHENGSALLRSTPLL